MVRISIYKKFPVLLIIGLFLFQAVIHAQKAERANRTIVYAGDKNFYPFEYLDDSGKPAGFFIDLLREISKKTNIKIEVELKKWSHVITGLKEHKKYDLAAVYFSNERAEFLDFGNPLFLTYDFLILNKNSNNITDISELVSHEVLVEKGGWSADYIRMNLPSIKIVEVTSEPEALKLVNEEKYDYAIVNYSTALGNIKRLNLKNVFPATVIIAPREYGFATPAGDTLLISAINEAVDSLKKEGVYSALYKKWFLHDESKEKYASYLKWTIFGILTLILLATLVFIWNMALKKKVRQKTAELTSELQKRILAEKKLNKSKAELERLSRIKTEFISQMSHEIRTPINIIETAYSLLGEEISAESDEDTSTLIDSINCATRRLTRTIDLLINFSEAKCGTYNTNKKELDIEEDILNRLIREYMFEAKRKNIEFNKTIKAQNRNIYADEYSVTQIFSNLIDNAFKFTNEGSVNIIVAEKEEGLAVSVEDTGIGISEEYLPDLFKPFTQQQQGYTRSYDGNGLGLSLTKKYCKINDARIKVKSKVGAGTKFTVIFGSSH